MLRIRLSRRGAKNNPYYRIVVIEKSRKTNGEAVETIGHWYPKKENFVIDKKRLSDWISKGAQTSKRVQELIDKKK
jgi:small subunit ribosomal protein S16